jgi:hypothetical protein
MKILIKIPVNEFDIFLSRCADAWLEEAALLNTGVPFSHEVQGVMHDVVSITCERAQATKLLKVAECMKSPAGEHIRRALGYPV